MSGRYEVKPGIIAFGSNLGKTQVYQCVFQIDDNFTYSHQAKLLVRGEQLSKYYHCNFF